MGSAGLWEEMDFLAAALGLSPMEKAVLSMARLEYYSLREVAEVLDLTLYQVPKALSRALRKCARRQGQPLVSARARFRVSCAIPSMEVTAAERGHAEAQRSEDG